MKIHVKHDGRDVVIPVPTGMIFSKASAWLWLKMIRKATEQYLPDDVSVNVDPHFTNLSEEAVYAVCAEIMQIKRKYGSWDLVEVETSDGTQVQITL